MTTHDPLEELVEIAARGVERSLTFMGMEGTRLPGTEAVDVDATVRAVLSAVSEAGWEFSIEGTVDAFQSSYEEIVRLLDEAGVTTLDEECVPIAAELRVPYLIHQRDQARAQAEALAEALENCVDSVTFGATPAAVGSRTVDAIRHATDALRAYRSSQESSDAA